jgi:redox-sensitive bicupin YhaK (pirin superfamily)
MSSSVVREAVRVVTAHRQREGAGFIVRRPFPTQGLELVDPFLLLDEMGPVDYGAGEAVGAPDHPHRGFETVTYMLAGQMRHGDNQGNSGLLGPGAVQWMTAGKGLVHSEIPEQKDGLMWGFQLWVNLPAKDKLTKPRYQDIQGDNVPEVKLGPGARARVLVGTVNGVKGPVMEVATDPLYFDLHLDANASYTATLPEAHNAFVYVYQGDAKIGAAATGIKAQEMALLTRGASLPVSAGAQGARLIVVAGRPLNEPVARYGPFVMNTVEEIHQAFADYQAGRL